MSEATAASPAAAPSAPSGGPSGSPSAPAAPESGSPAVPSTPKPASADKGKLSAAEQRYLFQRAREDGSTEDIDISGFKTKVKVDGREMELDLPRLVKLQQLELTSNTRLAEHANKVKEFERREAEFRRKVEALDNPDRMIGYLVDRWGEQGIYDKFATVLSERVAFERLPRADQERILRERQARQAFERDKQKMAAERAELERWKAEKAKAERAAKVKGWKAEWPETFKKMGLPIGEHANEQGHDPVFAEAFNRTLMLMKQNNELKLGKSLQQIHGEAVHAVKEMLRVAGAYASKQREASIQAQPGREQPMVPQGDDELPDNVRPIGGRRGEIESTSDLVDRLRGR